MKMAAFLAVLVFLGGASAYVKIVSPVDVAIEPLAETLIEPVGPGHDVILQFSRETEESIYWDSVELTNQVDSDWVLDSHSDSEYIYYLIGVPPNKVAGVSSFWIKIVDREGLMRSEEAEIKISVTRDPNELVEVMGFEEAPNLNAGEQGYAAFRIRNRALSVATYNVSVAVEGMPHLDNVYMVSIDPEETRQVKVPLQFSDEGKYSLKALVWTTDNSAIEETVSTDVYVRPTLQSKFRSIGQGFPMIPLTMAPFYAVLGLLGF